MMEYMPTDKQYNGQLIDEYHRLEKIYYLAIEEKAFHTAKVILEEMKYIKLKLQPVELPDLPQLPME
ncbi:MAG: hypothetical protein MR380_07020 [Lachnospiraceae bacterium]|nr:hypothetical protein [Lachnospiraceae bacterium]